MNYPEVCGSAQHFEDEFIFTCKVRKERHSVSLKIPPEFQAVSLEHKPVIEGFLRGRAGSPSELTFTNLFMWRNHFNFSFCVKGDVLLVRGEHDGKRYYFEPVGNGLNADMVLSIMQTEGGMPLERVSETFFEKTLQGDSRFDVQESREHWDYIYSRDDLAYLRGRHYHRKRNHLARFEQNYRYDYFSLDEALIPDCRQATEEWCRVRQCELDPGLCAEKEAVTEILDNYSNLDLIGGLVKVEGKPVAFTIGEALDDKAAVVHIEKAVKGYNGLYQVINKLFCERGLGGYELVNREQDLGIEGLRKAKESYYPVRMLKKYSVKLSG